MICRTQQDFDGMRKANKIVGDALRYAESQIRPGISTYELDKLVEKFIIDNGAIPSFKGFEGYPASICTSVNETVVHGIPSKDIILKEGDIISVDIGTIVDGYNGDAARTFPVGKISKEKQKLIDVTKQCFFEGIKHLRPGAKLGELGNAIQTYAESFGYGVVRELVGHGIGHNMHEDPEVPNYGKPNHGITVKENMCLAIEPMITMGERSIYMGDDGWTIKTDDGLPAGHYENTVIVTANGVEILSL